VTRTQRKRTEDAEENTEENHEGKSRTRGIATVIMNTK